MRRYMLSTLTAAALVAGAATIAAAQTTMQPDAYSYRGYSYDYYNEYNIPQRSPYDHGFPSSTQPTITDPGEGGGVQNPHLGPGINGSRLQ